MVWLTSFLTKETSNFFKKMSQPRPLFHFCLFKHTTIFTTNKCEKCPSSIRRRDSNSRPLEHEPPPVTTRPGLPLKKSKFSMQWLWKRGPLWQWKSAVLIRPPMAISFVIKIGNMNGHYRAVVVAQLVEWLLPLPEVRGLNPVSAKIYLCWTFLFTVNCVLKRRK